MDTKSYTVRVPKRWARIALVVGVTALIVAPSTAIAAHSGFDDVPDSHTFVDDIAWLKDADVTRGCNPPANTLYCPEDDVTRGQMAAFMRRFSQYLGAEDGTPAQADNAGQLGGADPSAYQSRVAGKLISATFGAAATAIETITGFTSPASGGVLVVTADATFFQGSGPQLAAMWIEVNQDGACSNPSDTAAIFETATGGFGLTNASTSTTDSVGPGDHRIDLCTVGIAPDSTNAAGSFTVQWVEASGGATIASAGGDRTVDDVLSDLEELAGDLLDG